MGTTARGRPRDPNAAYKRIAKELRKRMEAGEWPKDAVLPALRSLAGQYGVSRITVRCAIEMLRREGRVELGTGRRLVVKDPSGPPSVTDRLVLQVVPSFPSVLASALHRPLQAGIARGLSDVTSSHLVVANPRFRYALPAGLESLPLHGVLLLGHFRRSVFNAYERLSVPVVLVDRPPQAYRLHAACVDSVGTAQEATERLLEAGHRRIAFLRRVLTHIQEVDPDSKARQLGYERAFKRAGLKREHVWITNSTDYDQEGGPPFRSIFRIEPAVTAVVAADDGLASKVIAEARERGLTVPRDLSVVGFGVQGEPLSVSCFVFDFETVGREAAGLLKHPKDPPRCVQIRGAWVDAGTVAPPGRT